MRMAGSAMASMFGDQQSPRYDELANIGTQGRSIQRQMATQSDAQARMADINADATTQIAKFNAGAIKAQGQAQGQASMASGIGSMISGIAGGIGSMGVGGGATPASTAVPFGTNLGVQTGAKNYGMGYSSLFS